MQLATLKVTDKHRQTVRETGSKIAVHLFPAYKKLKDNNDASS